MIRKLNFITAILPACILVMACGTESCGNAFKANDGEYTVEIAFMSDRIVRISKYKGTDRPDVYSPSIVMKPEAVRVRVREKNGTARLATDAMAVEYDRRSKGIVFYDRSGNVLLKEKPASHTLYSQTFLPEPDETVYGLGQHRQGGLDCRGKEIYLMQENMEIGIPLVHSVKGYALFWNNCSPVWYRDGESGMSFESATGESCDYYFVYGGNADGVIRGLRALSGDAPMNPLWTYGFFQSKERYAGQEELVSVAREYRRIGVPLDAVVQDWRYWGDDNNYWNAVEFLSDGFPDPKRMVDELNELNVNSIISIWPSFGMKTAIYGELAAENLLLPFRTFPQDGGVKVYDPWNPKAREIYWKYIKKNVHDIGISGYWLDATEPEHTAVNPEDFEWRTQEGTFLQVRNSFPIVSVGGVHDHHREACDDKRVVILTRSAYFGQQRYGTHVWSGDVFADWKVLHNQIAAALNFTMCGMPYWNSDIGGFWTWREFPEGVSDPAYHRLYTRWLQFAVFTGMMRSHGSNTPREIFRFGKRGDRIFDIQEKFINLRYRLIPYIYGMSWLVTSEGASLMRPLVMDWPDDSNVRGIDDEYMFGNSLLVAPVVEDMESRTVYLPEGNWYDFFTGERYEGPVCVARNTPLEDMPVYVRAGTVLPVGPSVQFAKEKSWDDLVIRIYPGADGEFVLYEDENDGYGYEKGFRSLIKMTWNDRTRTLTVHAREGVFPGMLKTRNFRIVIAGCGKAIGLDNENYDKQVAYDGSSIKIRL